MALRAGTGVLALHPFAEQGLPTRSSERMAELRAAFGEGQELTSVVPCAMNSHLRTGADKGNPTV